jgi:hypothetical protein
VSRKARGALRFHRLQHFEDAEDAALPSPRLHFRADGFVERKNRDAVEMRKADVTERRRDASGLIELGRLAHRLARVNKEVDRKILLLIEQRRRSLPSRLYAFQSICLKSSPGV